MKELLIRLIEETGHGTIAADIAKTQKGLGGSWDIRDISHAIAVDADGCVIHREALVTFWREYHHLNQRPEAE